MNFHCKRGLLFHTLVTIFLVTTIANCTEIRQDVPVNHKESVVFPSASSLKMEARGDSDGLDVNAIEGKSKSSSVNEKSDQQPIILGTSKVAIVYSERKSSLSDKDKNDKNAKVPPRVVYPHKQTSTLDDRNWRGVRISSRDSYLDALEHSQTSKDPREGVISADTKPKISKLIRRDYTEGPVYRHPHEQYASSATTSKDSYHSPQYDINKNVARISYGGPTPEPFLPTPSDSYSLPVQSSANFNDNNDFYASPQISYGSPVPQTPIYGPPSNSHNRIPSPVPHSSYGPPSNGYPPAGTSHQGESSYGPPSNGYPPAGTPHQGYGPPQSSYGAPYAIQDYSQHLPSLPSMDFIWPFALKLNAFTLAKILLKLVIFKMIVKFIGLICLLLFIPKLEIIKKVGSNDDSDDSRKLLTPDSTLERLNILTAFVTSSIDKYDKKNENVAKSAKDCTSFGCRMRKFITHEESWNDYVRLFKNYISEETQSVDENQETLTNRVDS